MTNDIEAAARAAAEYVDGVWRKDAGTAWTPIRLPLIRDAVASALAHATRGGVKCAKCGEVISTAGCLCGSNTPVTIAPSHATGEGGTRGQDRKARALALLKSWERDEADAVAAIRADERERCAKWHDERAETSGNERAAWWHKDCAAAIRALPEAREGKS